MPTWRLLIVLLMAGAGAGSARLPPSHAATRVCSAAEPLKALPGLPEASGIALSRRVAERLWSINDSGPPVIIALDTTGAIKGTVRVTGAFVYDWEDISVGPCPAGSCLYIADIGDNRGTRREIRVYRTKEPSAGEASTAPVETFTAAYGDGPHDAEAAFVTRDGRIYLVTKERRDATLYRFPSPLRTDQVMRLERVASIGAGRGRQKGPGIGSITDADISPDGDVVALRSNQRLLLYRTADLLAGGSPVADVSVAAAHEPQGEGVALGRDGAVYLVGEGGDSRHDGTFTRLRCASVAD